MVKDSKLITLLCTFSKEEIKEFGKFVDSPYFRGDRNLIPLLNSIKKFYPDFESKTLSDEKLFAELFGNEKFNAAKLRVLLSDLNIAAGNFLVHNRLKKNSSELITSLAYEFKERGLEKNFLRTLTMLDEKIKDSGFDSDKCYDEYELAERLKFEYYHNKNDLKNFPGYMIKFQEYFLASFLIKFFRICRDKISLEKDFNIRPEKALFDALKDSIDFEKLIYIIESLKNKDFDLIIIYYYVYQTLASSENTEYYYKLKNYLKTKHSHFTLKEKFLLYQDLLSYCVEKERTGDTQFRQEHFELYKEILKNDAYTDGRYMNITFYRNFTYLCILFKEYNKLENFIAGYTDKLKPEFRENMKFYTYGFMYFGRGKFEEALKYISQVKYDSFLFKADIKHLMMKIYYELDIIEPAISLADAFKAYLHNTEEVSEFFNEYYLNFINFFVKILKIKTMGNSDDAALLEKDINKENVTASQKWLLEKISEITKRAN